MNYGQDIDVKCLKCGSNTFHHIGVKYEPCGEFESIDSSCISLHEDGEEWYICENPKCCCYHMRCPHCAGNDDTIQLCQFIGHDGVFSLTPRCSGYKRDVQKYRMVSLKMLPKHLQDEILNGEEFPPGSIEYIDVSSMAQYSENIFDSNYPPRYYVGDKDLFYADGQWIYLTGTDGGFYHEWKCTKCKHSYSITDK